IWVLALHDGEAEHNKGAQTGWRPLVRISDHPEAEIQSVELRATDGAGPVIWSVIKQLGAPTADRTKDIVSVTFSEPIEVNSDGISTSCKPREMFDVWHLDSSVNGSNYFQLLPDMLDEIETLDPRTDSSRAVFITSNGRDLNRNHWMNLDTVTRYVMDLSPRSNRPNDNNQKVRVKVIGDTIGPVIVIPNPSIPSVIKEKPGVINIIHNPNARTWVKENKGTVITFDIRIPGHRDVKIFCAIRIHDVVGNIVQSAKGELFAGANRLAVDTAEAANVDIYWNCTNDKGMIVAPGVYRVVVYVYYEKRGNARDSDVPKNRRRFTKLGITR
ncbi:MAG: hypothetical protein JXA71_14125, partial [Chitinispirillaceae bacterium]|nr:hypothetical protein [Chitinispirillaceae bacterium]